MGHIIKEYLKKNRLTAVQFCKDVGLSNTHLQHIYNRKRYPSRELCQRIYQYTDGYVTVKDLLNIKGGWDD
jgi:transcriptional regulator with XRE-family HTH domain